MCNWDQVYPMFYTNWDQVYSMFYTTASQSYKALFNNVSAVTCCPYLSPSLSFLFSSSFPFSFSLLSFLSTFTLPPATHVCSALSPFSLSLSPPLSPSPPCCGCPAATTGGGG